MVRSSKNAPSEVSSKKPVSVLREVIPVTKKKALDPRFDRSFGHFNEDLFSKTYGFLGETQKNELAMLEQSLKDEKNPVKRESLKRTFQRLVSLKKAQERKQRQQLVRREHRKTEAELIQQGKTPFYLKKADQRRLELAQEYQEHCQKRGKTELNDADLDRFLEKKRKRRASKQRRFMPTSS